MRFRSSSRGGSVNSRRPRRRFGFEALETRSLLSSFPVNTYTIDDQSAPSTSINKVSGASVVVWQSRNQYTSSSGYDIYGQLYNPDGSANGSEFLVNTTTANDQMLPSVSMNTSGNFVVTWQSLNQVSPTSGLDVYGKFFASGTGGVTASSSEFPVNTTTTAGQYNSSVSLNASNNFTVTWMSEGQGPTQIGSNGGGGGGGGAGAFIGGGGPTLGGGFGTSTIVMNIQGVMAQQFSGSTTLNTKTGLTEVTVNTFQSNPEGFIQHPYVAMDSSGRFAVAFSAEDFGAVFGGVSYDMDYAYGRRFNSGATAMDTAQVMINTLPGDNADFASISGNADGLLVVTWSGSQQGATPGLHSGVFAQLWSFWTTPSPEITVSGQNSTADKWNPRVSMNDPGAFQVVWLYNDQTGGGSDVYTRSFGSTGSPTTSESQVNDDGRPDSSPVVALDNSGHFMVAWAEPDCLNHLPQNIRGRHY
jgi:hypothetical protein